MGNLIVTTSLLFDVNYKFNNGNFAFIIAYIYIISYVLPWVLRPKKYYYLEIYPFSFKGSMVFLAFPHNRFWPVRWYETVILTCKKCTGIRRTKSSPQRKKERESSKWLLVFFASAPKAYVYY